MKKQGKGRKNPPKPSELARDQRSGLTGPSEAQQRRLVEAILNGASRRAARIAAGISATTFYSWCAKGKDPLLEPYASFRAALLDAEAEVEENMSTVIVESAPDDWKAAAWWLERRRPKAFGKRAPAQPVLGKDTGLSGDALRELRESMLAGLLSAPKREDES